MGIGSSFKAAAKSSGEVGEKAAASAKKAEWGGKLPEPGKGIATLLGPPRSPAEINIAKTASAQYDSLGWLGKKALDVGYGGREGLEAVAVATHRAKKNLTRAETKEIIAAVKSKASPVDVAAPQSKLDWAKSKGTGAMKWVGNNKLKTVALAGLGTAAYMSTQSSGPAATTSTAATTPATTAATPVDPNDPFAFVGAPADPYALPDPMAHLEGVPSYY